MLIRHGRPFWDELYGDNHWRRLVRGTPRRSRHLRVLPARARLRDAALDRARAGGAGHGGVRRCRARHLAGARRRRRARPPPRSGARDLLVRRDLVRRRLRAGVAVGHQVPPLHPARHPGPGDRDRLLPGRPPRPARRPRRRGGRARWASRCWRWCSSISPAQPKNAQHFIWLFSYDYINTPGGRPWPPGARFPALADRLRRRCSRWRRSRSAGAASSAGPSWGCAWRRSRSPTSCSTATCGA